MSEETHTHKFTPTLSFRSWGLQGDMSTSQTDIHAQTETWQRDLSTSLHCQMCQERPVYPSTEEIRLIYLQVNTEIICQCNFLWVCGRSACVIPLLRRLGVWRGRQKRQVRCLSSFLGTSKKPVDKSNRHTRTERNLAERPVDKSTMSDVSRETCIPIHGGDQTWNNLSSGKHRNHLSV